MKIKYDNPVRTNVTKEIKEEIDNFCKINNLKISDFLRDAIELYLLEKKKQIKDITPHYSEDNI
jgi:hypothetical protein